MVPSTDVPGFSNVYRHPKYKDGTHGGNYSDITTIYELFMAMERIHPNTDFLGTRRFYPESNRYGAYEWLSTTDAARVVDDFGSGLDKIYATYASQVSSQQSQQPLGIYSSNRAEWILAELAAVRTGRYSVGLTNSIGVDVFESDINASALQVIVCSIDMIPRMLERIHNTPRIKVIISMDRLDCSKPTTATQAFSIVTTNQLKARADRFGVVVMDMDQVIEIGRVSPTKPTPPTPSDYCTLCFTSGAAGYRNPILATHASLAHAARAAHLTMQRRNATFLANVPLSHIAGRSSIYALMYDMVHIGFPAGGATDGISDMEALRPTVIFAFPDQLNRIYKEVAATTIGAGGLTGFLARIGYRSKLRCLKSKGRLTHTLWDRVTFGGVAQKLGGRVELVITGWAALSEKVQDLLRVSLSCSVIQGYMQTEIAGCALMQSLDDRATGIVGVPQPGFDICLRSIPKFGYNVADTPCPRGELMVRRDDISFSHSSNAYTSEYGSNEWLATGDIVRLNTDGTFTYLGRVSNVIGTLQGQYRTPEHLESIYSEHEIVQSLFLYGDESERELVAVVVPSPDKFVPWARQLTANPHAELEDLCAIKAVAAAVTELLNAHASRQQIAQADRISAVHLEPLSFSQISSEFYTSTSAVRRDVIASYYRPVFDSLYQRSDANDAATVSPSCISDKTFFIRDLKDVAE
ncbi:medium-chain fatty acid-CoA ligase faa2 [Coemansia interrupta]|uniref:Medium-chain fatty acid-CoA ligase faa2 n=1 Tax=Coemansia interrupta TaxID=1126814 RepID=A0A9W8HPV0_9FUNG|nr:medium-chain fatty acid-CoA ligase faa2 [Coemansia interrupta]